MKKVVIGVLIGISLMAFIGAEVINYQVRKSTAEVPNYMGLYIFFDNTPVMEYETIGEVKVGITSSQRYNDIKHAIVKKAKKQFPNCDAVIIYPASDALSSERADAIKFKD